MPQVNEISWLFSFSKFLFLMSLIFMFLHFIWNGKLLNSSNCKNLNNFKFFI